MDYALVCAVILALGAVATMARKEGENHPWLRSIATMATFFAVGITVIALLVWVVNVVGPGEDPTTPLPTDSAGTPGAPPSAEWQTDTLTFRFSSTNDHCAGNRDVEWPIRARESWLIDVTSIEVRPNATNKSSYHGVTDRTEEGFTIRGRVGNRGECVRVFGKVIARDARGTLKVSGSYVERQPVP